MVSLEKRRRRAQEEVVWHWVGIADREGEIVPAYGFAQSERELASAAMAASVLA
jgi:hypothetical protein